MQLLYLDHATMLHVYADVRSSKPQLVAIYPFARRDYDCGIQDIVKLFRPAMAQSTGW